METIKITASLGVSTLHDGDTLESFVKQADDAMYVAKHNGRNQVALARGAN
jgi:diguanylate cyclase (GGDEF)-like protein